MFSRTIDSSFRTASVLTLLALASAPALAAQDGEIQAVPPAKSLRPFERQRDVAIPTRLPALRRATQRDPSIQPRIPTGRRPAIPPARAPAPRGTSPSRSPSPSRSDYAALSSDSDGCTPISPNTPFNFDLGEVEVEGLVETISKNLCKNFILSSKVRGQKVKVISPTKVRGSLLWRVFLAVLEQNDLIVVPAGRYWKVEQAAEGTRKPIPFYGEGESLRGRGRTFDASEQMVTKLYRVQHGGNTNNIVNYLNIFKSNRGQLHPFQGSNLIIMTDYASSLQRLEEILQELDEPDVLERVHVVPVSYASASEISEKLTQVFEPQNAAARKSGATKPTPRIAGKAAIKPKPAAAQSPEAAEGDAGTVSKIIADDRTNKLIIIASDSAFRQIIALMRQLDVPEDAADGQIHVLRLKHADSEELASTLSSLAQGGSSGGAANRTRRGLSGRNRPAAANASSGPASAALFEGDVKITADKATNSLVITASKSDLSSIRRVIDQLDVPRFQVFVEAAILEVSTSNNRDLGVGWHAGIPLNIDGEDVPLLLANTPKSELSSLTNTINPLGLASLLGLASAFRGPTFDAANGLQGIPSTGIPAVGVVLQALQASNDVNVVSTPHLLTVDNEEAEIQVNEKRPFPSGLSFGSGLAGLASAAGASGNNASSALGNLGGLGLGSLSFNREDVGLTLKIKPQINDEDYVRLEIDQELSDVAGTDQVTGQVITSKRAAKTTVVVRSQDSVVIGGLVRDRETRGESKFPLLGDIPVLGWLFKSQNRTIEKVNLVLVLTPYIIRGPDDFRQIFERKMEERREFVELFYGRTEEYRAKIDWNRKVGPLATYQARMRKELMKAENEGPGLPGQTVIRAQPSDDPSTGIPLNRQGSDEPMEGGGSDELPPPEPAVMPDAQGGE